MDTAVVTTTITAVATTIVALSNIYLNSQRKKDRDEARQTAARNAAKSSIQNMITQDIIRAELLHKMPENIENIEVEYKVYHDNGGNSTIDRQFEEYIEWYKKTESHLNRNIHKTSKKCTD